MTDVPERLATALRDRYSIEHELGAGGMATVYLAHDLKHDRKVALKVLKPELAAVVGGDRFLAEIRTTANLQHPHILPLFDSGEADGFLYFVMPFVEGESLRMLIDRERELPVADAVRIAKGVADALGHAHRRGIIHRDIKPANILLHEGRPLVADFGIALAVSTAGGGRLTETGLSVGTPHYMSPEQATGDRTLDPRSDIYALGCMLYEMLAGRPPHQGSSAQAILAKILTTEPEPLKSHRSHIPWAVADTVGRALSRLPADRPGSAEEFVSMLDRPDPVADARTDRRFFVTLPIVMAAAFAAGLVLGPRGESIPQTVSARRQVTFTGQADKPSLSPDGTRLVYVDLRCATGADCRQELVLQDLTSGGNPIVIEPFNEPYESATDFYWSVEWSPDGDQLILTRARSDSSLTGIYVMPPFGKAPRLLHAEVATSAVFRPDGRTVDWIGWPQGFVPGTAVWRTMDLATGSITSSRPMVLHATQLTWSPDGKWMAAVGRPWSGPASRPFLSLWSADGSVADTLTGPPGATGWPVVQWTGQGDAVLVMAGGALFRIPVNTESGSFDRRPDLVMDGFDHPGWLEGRFSMAASRGRIAWVRSTQRTEIRTLDERGGTRVDGALRLGTAWADYPAVSLDGERVAYIKEDPAGFNIYVEPFAGGEEVQLTSTAPVKRNLEWSPDGQYLAYIENDGAVDWLSIVPTSVAQPRRLSPAAGWIYGQRFSWMPNGRSLVFVSEDERVSRVDIAGNVEPLFPLPDSVGILWEVLVSGDGASVATVSHRFVRGGSRYLVYTTPVSSSQWTLRMDAPMTAFDTNLLPSSGPSGYRSQSPTHWKSDGNIELAVGNSTGSGFTSTVWLIDEKGDRRLVRNISALCGAPTVVSTSWDGRRLVCVRRDIVSDIWLLDGFDQGDH